MAEIARAGLAVAGGLIGGWKGYLVGTLIGGLLFPPASREKPENLASMRLAGPTPGSPLPIAAGRTLVRGHVIWHGPLIEQQGGKKGGGGGKKGGGQEITYRRSFLHVLCEGHPDITLLRIYSNDDLLWDATDPGPSQESGIDFTFYPGAGTDTPDPRMAAYQSGGGGSTTTIRTETTVLPGAAPTYTVREVPVVSGSDSIFHSTSSGTIIQFTRVASSPAQNEYTINYATGLVTFGGSYSNITVTIRYRISTQTSAQEPLAYRHVCKVYVHEMTLVGQSLPQLTYELQAPLTIPAPTGVFGWARRQVSDPAIDPPPFQRNRFFRVGVEGTMLDLGNWPDIPVAQGGEGDDTDVGRWVVTGLAFNALTERWYVGAVNYSDVLIWTIESAVFITTALPPPGSFSTPGAGVARVAYTTFTGSWAGFAERVWDLVVDDDGNTYAWRDLPNAPVQIIRIATDNTVTVLGTPATIADPGSLTVHNGTLYYAGSTVAGETVFGYWDGTQFINVSYSVSGAPAINGGPNAEDLRLERVAGRLYLGASNGTFRYREADTTFVLQSGVGKVFDWHEEPWGDRILGMGQDFIASTPVSTVSDAWTSIVSGIGTLGGLSIHLDRREIYYLRDEGAQVRLYRLDGSTPVLIHTFTGEDVIFPSRMLAAGYVLTESGLFDMTDLQPVDVQELLMTHTRFGAGLPASLVNSASRAAIREYCALNDLLVSGVIENHASCLQHIEDIMTHYFGWMAFRQGQFVFGAQREETALREIVLDDAVEGGEPTFNLPGERDTKNRIRVDYTDRSRRYNTMPTHVGDDPDRAARGERAENLRLPWFATVERARSVAAKMLALKSVPRAGYEMTLGPKEIALAPGDVVALTAVKLGLSQEPVRIVAIGEIEDRAEFRLTVASEPSAVLALRTYPIQPLNPGDQPGSPGVDPGPTLFTAWEVPPELAGEDVVQTAFIMAGTGNPEWRGASVYMSLDGTNYSRVATVLGANGGIGLVTAGRDAGPAYEDTAVVDADLSLSLGSLLSYTRNLALAGASLALAGQQHSSYRQADLQAANRYRLRGLMRGWFEQSQVNVAPSDGFTFIGEFIDLPTVTHPHSRIGTTVTFKAVSINRFGVEQSLADAQTAQVTLQGLARRPSPVYGPQLDIGGQAQGSRTVIGTGQISVSCRWRYARRDNPEDADLVDGLEVTEKHAEFLEYRVQVYTRASGGDAWGLRRTAFQAGETFTYTAAQNIADNGTYHRFIRFDVAVRRTNGVLSITKTLAVEVVQ